LIANAKPHWDEAQKTFLDLIGDKRWTAMRGLLRIRRSWFARMSALGQKRSSNRFAPNRSTDRLLIISRKSRKLLSGMR
jgi:hypothetical protein